MVTVQTFKLGQMPRYTHALWEGNWYAIGHFDTQHAPMVWLCEAHGNISGYVECSRITSWALSE